MVYLSVLKSIFHLIFLLLFYVQPSLSQFIALWKTFKFIILGTDLQVLDWAEGKMMFNFIFLSNFNYTIFTTFTELGINIQVHYFWPLDDQAFKEFEKIWCEITNQCGGRIISSTIPVIFGRYVYNIINILNRDVFQ